MKPNTRENREHTISITKTTVRTNEGGSDEGEFRCAGIAAACMEHGIDHHRADREKCAIGDVRRHTLALDAK